MKSCNLRFKEQLEYNYVEDLILKLNPISNWKTKTKTDYINASKIQI